MCPRFESVMRHQIQCFRKEVREDRQKDLRQVLAVFLFRTPTLPWRKNCYFFDGKLRKGAGVRVN